MAEGAISCQTSISVTSPLVVTSFARAENSGGSRQRSAQGLTPVEGMGTRMIVESFSLASAVRTPAGRHGEKLVDGFIEENEEGGRKYGAYGPRQYLT